MIFAWKSCYCDVSICVFKSDVHTYACVYIKYLGNDISETAKSD